MKIKLDETYIYLIKIYSFYIILNIVLIAKDLSVRFTNIPVFQITATIIFVNYYFTKYTQRDLSNILI